MIKRFMLKCIRLYQKYLSPMKSTKCPYYPTCSAYAVKAIENRGVVVGTALAAWRLVRCNPFSHGGYDPVPEKGFKKKFKKIDITGNKTCQ